MLVEHKSAPVKTVIERRCKLTKNLPGLYPNVDLFRRPTAQNPSGASALQR